MCAHNTYLYDMQNQQQLIVSKLTTSDTTAVPPTTTGLIETELSSPNPDTTVNADSAQSGSSLGCSAG